MSSQLDLFASQPCEGPQQYEQPGLALRYWPEWASCKPDFWLQRPQSTARTEQRADRMVLNHRRD